MLIMIAMVVIIQFTKNLRRSFHATFQLLNPPKDRTNLVLSPSRCTFGQIERMQTGKYATKAAAAPARYQPPPPCVVHILFCCVSLSNRVSFINSLPQPPLHFTHFGGHPPQFDSQFPLDSQV